MLVPAGTIAILVPLIIKTSKGEYDAKIRLLINYDAYSEKLQMATLEVALPPREFSDVSIDILYAIKSWYDRGKTHMTNITNRGINDETITITNVDGEKTKLTIPIYREGELEGYSNYDQYGIYMVLSNYIIQELKSILRAKGLYGKLRYHVEKRTDNSNIVFTYVVKEINDIKQKHGKVIYYAPNLTWAYY